MPRLRRAAVHVAGRLRQPLAYRALQALVQHLALDHEPACGMRRRPGRLRPDDQQVGAPASQTVLPLDAPAAVDDSLQERLQQELRAGFGVVEARDPVFGVLAEERLEGGQQLVEVEAAVGVDVPGEVLRQLLLRDPGQFPRHDFRVDRVGNAHRPIPRHQAQVPQVLQVAVGERTPVTAAQQWLDHAPHTVLLERVSELVEVGHPAQDQVLLGVEEVVCGNRAGVVASRIAAEARSAAERVHQPRLAAGLPPHRAERVRRERLPRLFGVLGEQRAHVGLREVAQAQRFGLDVERAAAHDDRVLGAGVDAVVADVTHAAQHDALRKAGGTPVVAGPQLAEHGDQRVADQSVDLVDQQHYRFRLRLAPARQRLRQGAGAEGRQDVGKDVVQELVAHRTRP